jgi:pyridoxal phosphate enzyme (YggS family)
MSDFAARIAENLADTRRRIAEAARASGREADAVRLVAVTKYVGLPETAALLAAGCRELGESRPQALWEKAPALAGEQVNWHLIGHLQRNKIRRTLPLVSLIHSADSERLIRALHEEATALGRRAAILLEVNVSGDAAKHGFAPAELERLLPTLPQFAGVEVRGLMTMAAREGGEAVARRNFADLRALRDRLRTNCPAEIRLDELSMGMSGDYEAAIREGATLVRVGSALFEGVEE